MRSSAAPAESPQALTRARPLLGTIVSMRVDAVGDQGDAAIAAAFANVADVQRTMSFHDVDSELSALNRDACRVPQRVSPALHRVLSAALAMARASAGRFDPTVAWRLVGSGHLPAPVEVEVDVDPLASWRDVTLSGDGRVSYRRALWIDLGGIAKGYAVDRAVHTLKGHGITSGTVNAGGDLRTFGGLETIQVRDPADPGRQVPILQVRDAAVATSAGYFSGLEGRTALVDPSSGTNLGTGCSVTVCARRAVWADALTKVVLAAPDEAAPVLRRLQASALILHVDGQRRRVN